MDHTLGRYLRGLDGIEAEPRQAEWLETLRARAARGHALYLEAEPARRARYDRLMRDWRRTEELKAWYGAPQNGSLFQGTSVSSLTIPAELPEPLPLAGGIGDLEEAIADHYVALHDRHAPAVRAAILENTDRWLSEGVFFGVVLSSKIVSQAFGLTVADADVVFPIGGTTVDPHEITSYPSGLRQEYFEQCRHRISCFADIADLEQSEVEASLVLADISKPRIERYRNRLLLAPIRCNEIATLLSRSVTSRIREKTGGRIAPRSLMVTIYDTDTPYTYEQITGSLGRGDAFSLPGLVVMGTSGSIDAFRWLYAYRVSLVAQKMMKGSLWSEVARCFVPFVFFGVLVERDAEILLDLDRLGLLRYRGNLSPLLEVAYLVPKMEAFLNSTRALSFEHELARRTGFGRQT